MLPIERICGGVVHRRRQSSLAAGISDLQPFQRLYVFSEGNFDTAKAGPETSTGHTLFVQHIYIREKEPVPFLGRHRTCDIRYKTDNSENCPGSL